MKFGFCTNPSHIAQCQETGYDYVELYLSDMMDMTPKELNFFLDYEHGIPIEIGIMRIPRFLRIAKSDLDLSFSKFYFEECLNRVTKLGIRKLVFGSGDARSTDLNNNVELRKLLSFFDFARNVCEKRGITLSVEAMSCKLCDTFNRMLETELFFNQNNLKEIGITIDNFHMVSNGELINDIFLLQKISHVHLSNPINRHPPAPLDDFDYRKMFYALKSYGYNDSISIEINETGNPEMSKTALQYLRMLSKGCAQ